MKCEHCGKNEVSFVYRSNINGQIEERHLCAECAQELGYTERMAAQSRSMMRSFFGRDSLFGGGLLEDFFTPLPSLMGRMLEDPFDDFFADMPALGAPVEQQEQPQKAPDDLLEKEEREAISKTRQLNALRMEMRRAVREENFERAAEIRDQLRQMEAEDTEGKE